MATPLLPELAQLDAIRLRRDWSFSELSDAMAARGCRIAPRTLHYLLKGGPTKPLDRTIYKIRVYVEHVREMARRTRTRRVNAAAKTARAIAAAAPVAAVSVARESSGGL